MSEQLPNHYNNSVNDAAEARVSKAADHRNNKYVLGTVAASGALIGVLAGGALAEQHGSGEINYHDQDRRHVAEYVMADAAEGAIAAGGLALAVAAGIASMRERQKEQMLTGNSVEPVNVQGGNLENGSEVAGGFPPLEDAAQLAEPAEPFDQ